MRDGRFGRRRRVEAAEEVSAREEKHEAEHEDGEHDAGGERDGDGNRGPHLRTGVLTEAIGGGGWRQVLLRVESYAHAVIHVRLEMLD